MLALLLLILILQQPSPKATIEGRVTAAETGAPLKNARVRLSGGPNYDREVRTDDTGSFVIPDVEPESYHMRVDQNGYLAQANRAPGSDFPGNFSVAAGGRYRFDFALVRAGMLSGRLLDNNRQPIANASIQLLGVGFDELGNRSLVTFNIAALPNLILPASTNKQGEFQFTGITPGEYFIRYSSKISPTYYPGVARADDAIPVRIAGRADIRGIEFSPNSATTFNVSGRFTNPFVRGAVTDYEYALAPRNTKFSETIGLTEHPQIGEDAFKFENVSPGSYDLYITYRDYVAASNGIPYVGHTVVDVVDRDVTDLDVEVRKGLDVKIEIVLDESAAALKPQSFPVPRLIAVDALPVGAQPLGINLPRGLSAIGSSITLSNVTRGRYILNYPAGPGLYVSTERFGTRDVLGQPFDIDDDDSGPLTIELSASGAAMEGIVTGRDGAPAAGARVWLIPPVNRRQDRSAYLTVSADGQGRFKFITVAPATYTVFSFPSSRDAIPVGGIMNREFMTPYLGAGVSVELPKGQTIRQDLNVISQ